MAWLRIDDGFANHPKLAELTDREFRVWMRLLCYCARYPASRVRVTLALRYEVAGLDPKALTKLSKVALLDEVSEGVYEVHDWQDYNPSDATAAERAKRYRERKQGENVTETSRDSSRPERDANGSSRAGRRARPVPSPEEETATPSPSSLDLEPQLGEPPGSVADSAGSPTNGRAPNPDEWFSDEPKIGGKKGKATPVAGDSARPYRRDLAEAYVRNVAIHDPHPSDALRAQYADIPTDDLIELTELACDLARTMGTSA